LALHLTVTSYKRWARNVERGGFGSVSRHVG